MACFTLRGPNGDRKVAENENYRLSPGEAIVPGLIDWNCDGHNHSNDLESIISDEGFMLGNAIKKVTHAVGITQCMKCKGRQRRYNDAGLVIQQKIKDIFK